MCRAGIALVAHWFAGHSALCIVTSVSTVTFAEFAAWAGWDESRWGLLPGVLCDHPCCGPACVSAVGMRYGEPNVTIKPTKSILVLLTADTGGVELTFDRASLATILRNAGYRVATDPPGGRSTSRGAAPRGECWQKTEVAARKIHALCHFTPLPNVPGILKRGILPRSSHGEVKPLPLLCDEQRLDRHLDASSLSVSFPNHKLFTACRHRYKDRAWAVLLLSPEILRALSCSYYYTNAASGAFDHSNPELYQTRNAFSGLFADPVGTGRRSKSLELCFPTDPQAEVLAFGAIDPRFILSIQVENVTNVDHLARYGITNPICVSDLYFGPRRDYKSWKKVAPAVFRSGGSVGPSVEEEVPF